ncbi:aldo-keto reductase family 1 member B7-like [Diadema antillarum]|uniref:aldo-keto reductase family 1 member B7-like n=1 Tax=Diadema antillarum TaxID=105358 RepID=UPI003A8AA1EE
MAGSNVYADLPNGAKIPLLGLGTWRPGDGDVCRAVEAAIDCGYRHIDTAFIYGNEAEVGKAIKTKIDDGTIKREDLFVTTKLWLTNFHPDHVEENVRESLTSLGLDYVDLYLMHWPVALVHGKGAFPLDENGVLIGDDSVDYVDAWKGMESLVDKGLVKAIGVSNFNIAQIERLLSLPPKHPISNNQVESHPRLTQTELIEFCSKHGITVTAFSPLGSPERPDSTRHPDDPVLMEEPVVCQMAQKLGKSPAQILIRYQIQRGVIVVPKSFSPTRIQQNFEALNFTLPEDDLLQLSKLNKNHHLLRFEMAKHCKNYPF